MKIIWSPLAIDRTVKIAEYIALDNPTAAQKWVDIIFQEVKLLVSSPRMGRVIPEIGSTQIRELIVGNYRIIYRIEKINISILTIRHGKQILPVEEIIA